MSTPPDAHHLAHQHLALDPVMADLQARHGPLPPLSPAADPFLALVRAVAGQQLSVRAADAIYARLMAAVGEGTSPDVPARLLALPAEQLRALGLSWAKVRTVQAAAAAAVSGELDFARLHELPDEAVITALVALPGIGRWTAEMFLMFSLARPDVFSLGDLGLRRGLEHFYPGVKREDWAAVISAWAPHRTLAARYLWHARP